MPGYRREYKRHVKVFQEYFGDSDVREIASKKICVSDFIDHLEKTYVTTGVWKYKTLKNCVDKLETFLNRVHDELELVPSVPSFLDIETETAPRRKGKKAEPLLCAHPSRGPRIPEGEKGRGP